MQEFQKGAILEDFTYAMKIENLMEPTEKEKK